MRAVGKPVALVFWDCRRRGETLDLHPLTRRCSSSWIPQSLRQGKKSERFVVLPARVGVGHQHGLRPPHAHVCLDEEFDAPVDVESVFCKPSHGL